MAWTDYSTAPRPGTPVAPLAEINGAVTTIVTTENGAFPLLLVRAGSKVHAYVNACPHQYLPLDYRGSRILSADGERLMCTGHGAQFDAKTGAPVTGADCSLDRVPVDLIDGVIVIASVATSST